MNNQDKLQTIEARPAPVSISSTAMDMAEMDRQTQLINDLLRKRMVEATKANSYQGHYGIVPGTRGGYSLYKLGAEMIAKMFRLGATYEYQIEELEKDHINVQVKAIVTHYPTGTTLGCGVGSCSTMERKYRYRRNAKGDTIENADPADQWNTALKIAKKRAYVDAIQTLTAAGDLFMQNAEFDDDQESPPPKQNGQRQQQTQQRSNPPAQQREEPMIDYDARFSQQYQFDANGNPLCPKCGGPMWDNRKGQRHAERGPDFACKDKTCKWMLTKAGNWTEGSYPTAIFRIEYTGANESDEEYDHYTDDEPGY